MISGVNALVTFLTALGGLGLGSLLTIKGQKKKLLSESGKTDAEADGVLADAYGKRTTTQIALLEPYERIMKRQGEEIDEQAAEIRQLRRHIETLTRILRQNGWDVPEMPDKPPSPAGDAARQERS